jgi:hypothetical protein
MKTIFLLLLPLVHCLLFNKISSLGGQLTPGDYLVSALGQFRLTLNPQTCQLQIEAFSTSRYVAVGYYPRSAQGGCSWLAVSSNALRSESGQALLSLKNGQLGARFDEVFVTIDETAIVRISGIYLNQYQTAENWISIFRSPRQYVYSVSNLSVSTYHSLSFVQNAGNWGFSATRGELRIFRVDNASKIRRYNYTAFTMTPGNIFDYNSNALPYADFRDFLYQPKCTNTQSFAFQGPFTFAANPYFPELRVLDQNGYEVVAIRYPEAQCEPAVGVDFFRDDPRCLSWFCPGNMFEHEGTCVTACPTPYFSQLGRNSRINRCLLSCETDYQRDSLLRICDCGTPALFACPSGTTSTPLGCLCPRGSFYSGVNQPSNSSSSTFCLSSCGPRLYEHGDGLCVPCPLFCLKCALSGSSYNYLKCLGCEEGFTASPEGYCVRDCAGAVGKVVVNGSCAACAVEHCRNCSGGVKMCSGCLLPYSFLNNSCLGKRTAIQRTALRAIGRPSGPTGPSSAPPTPAAASGIWPLPRSTTSRAVSASTRASSASSRPARGSSRRAGSRSTTTPTRRSALAAR